MKHVCGQTCHFKDLAHARLNFSHVVNCLHFSSGLQFGAHDMNEIGRRTNIIKRQLLLGFLVLLFQRVPWHFGTLLVRIGNA